MADQKFETWAIVEIMGHVTYAGFVTEHTIAGLSFVRVDVPATGDRPAFTKLFGPGAIYCITPVEAEEASRNSKKQPAPKGATTLLGLPACLPMSVDAVGDDDDIPF